MPQQRSQQGYFLSTRALWLGATAFVFLFAAQLGGRYFFDLPLMHELVARADSKDWQRVDKALTQRRAIYESRVTDNAIWNDAFAFALDPQEVFLASNFDRRTLADNDLDGVIFLDAKGELIWHYGVDFGHRMRDKEQLSVLPIEAEDLHRLFHIEPHKSQGGSFETRDGYVNAKAGPLVFSASPIFPTNLGEGKVLSAGTLIMWAWLDEDYFASLAEQTKLNLTAVYLPLGRNSVSLEWQHLLRQSSEGRDSQDRWGGFLFDVDGEPIALMWLQFDALGPEHRLLSSSAFVGVVAAFLLLLGLALVVKHYLVNPLDELGRQMSEITAAGAYEDRLTIKGYAELEWLARQFNLLLEEVSVQQEIARKKHAKLHLNSISDGLTGLANRRYLDQFMDESWAKAKAQRSTYSLLLIDIDYFKKYNDTYGHAAGDKVLRQVAQLLQSCQPNLNALTARYGGEEFCMVILGASCEAISILCESICAAVLEQAVAHTGSNLGYLSVSVGAISVFAGKPLPDDLDASNALRTIFKAADTALYEAKNNGRNTHRMGFID